MARRIVNVVLAIGKMMVLPREAITAADYGVASQSHRGKNSAITANSGGDKAEEVQSIDENPFAMLGLPPISTQKVLDDGKLNLTNRFEAESSKQAARRSFDSSKMNHRCEACREEIGVFDALRISCGHEYCRDCLGELFAASMTDESLFPPRCCQPISIKSVRYFLKPETLQSFEKKRLEFEASLKFYCHAPRCSAFIPSRNVDGDVATCPECYLATCTICKHAAHEGDCPYDTLLQKLLDTARENNWQRCYRCSRVVELEFGCQHIMLVDVSLD